MEHWLIIDIKKLKEAVFNTCEVIVGPDTRVPKSYVGILEKLKQIDSQNPFKLDESILLLTQNKVYFLAAEPLAQLSAMKFSIP